MTFMQESISVQFSCSVLSESLRPHGLQHTTPPCASPTPRAYSNSCPLCRWFHPTISTSVVPFSSSLQSFPHHGLSKWVSSSHQVAKGLEFQVQHQSFQWIFRMDWFDLLAVQGTLKSSPTPQFKNICSLRLRFHYSPTLTSIHDYWKNHSFD